MTARKKKTDVAHEDFVRAWQEASSVEDVAKTLSTTVAAANQRARAYRRIGVKLKRMSAAKPIPVEQLNELISQLQVKGEEEK